MPAKGARREKPDSRGTLLARYLEPLDLQNHSHDTIKKRQLQLNAFVGWCELRSLTRETPTTAGSISKLGTLHSQTQSGFG